MKLASARGLSRRVALLLYTNRWTMLFGLSPVHAKVFQSFARRLYSRMAAQTVKVQVRQGVIVGRKEQLPNGIPYECFQGIPYAVPPLGKLRFKSPVPLERFNVDELDCTSERSVSFHRDAFTQELVGSEDCLFLNVYTPKGNSAKPKPVMVWIHGGGFMFNSGNSDFYLPLSLMQEDVVVVTMNYRLNALGFLSLPEEGIWGNAALKDQRLALQWVHDNIASFNGDPNNVTLFGESSGASCIHLHCYSQHAHKLFHKAIIQSGTVNVEWVFQADPHYKTRRFCELLGCKSKDTRDMLTFLQSEEVTPLALLTSTMPVLNKNERRCGLPLTFRPIIEDSNSPDSIITTPIMERLKQHDTFTMPIIMGYNSREGIGLVVNALRKLDQCDKDLARFVPRNIPLPPDHIEIQNIAKKMRDFYLGGRALAPETLNELAQILTDYHFAVDIQKMAELQVRHQPRAPLYFYRFDYVGGRNIYKRMFQLENLKGACHGDEIFYLFQMAGDDSSVAADDQKVTKLISGLWANFARYNEPTPRGNAISTELGCNWTAVKRPVNEKDTFTLDYLAIDKPCEMRQNPDQARMEFWRNIYRDYEPIDYSRLSAKL